MRKISIEAVKLAASVSDKTPEVFTLNGMPGWISSGHWAVKVDDPKEYGAGDGMFDRDTNHAEKLGGYLEADVIPVTEDISSYQPWIDEVEEKREGDIACMDCRKTGKHVCSCRHEHDCSKCYGTGYKKGTVVVPGRRFASGRVVYKDSLGFRVTIQARFKDLLEGLLVSRTGNDFEPLVGIDPDTKETLVIIMPFRDNLP